MVTSNDIARGRIFWLQTPKDLGLEDSEDSEDYDEEPWYHPRDRNPPPESYKGVEYGLLGHPVMVLHELEGTTDVAVCLVSITSYFLQ